MSQSPSTRVEAALEVVLPLLEQYLDDDNTTPSEEQLEAGDPSIYHRYNQARLQDLMLAMLRTGQTVPPELVVPAKRSMTYSTQPVPA